MIPTLLTRRLGPGSFWQIGYAEPYGYLRGDEQLRLVCGGVLLWDDWR